MLNRWTVRAFACLAAGLLAAGSACSPGPTGATEDWPLTRAERSGFTETSRYAEVIAFMEAVAERSPDIHLRSFGFTHEGRSLPLAVVTNLPDPTAASIRESGRLRVYVQGNIHAGEVCGKEALQMLLRQIARGEHARWLDHLVLLIAPIYNADGNERISLTNRPGQYGPIGGMGQRPNAQGLDLNRDHMKAESPEARSLLALLNEYDPHVGIDLHTTNGTRHAYHLTYAPPLNPNTPAAIDELLRREWLPAVTDAVRERTGEEFYYYGNLPFRPGTERGWYTFDHRPRFNNNYLGLRNRVAILSEAYAYASYEERVMSSLSFVEAILDYATDNAAAVRAAIDAAEAEPLPGTQLALRATWQRSDEPVEILLGDVEITQHPFSGRRMARRLDVTTPETMPEFGTFTATETEEVPTAYLIPAELGGVIDRLATHGIEMEPATETALGALEHFEITGSTQAEREFQGHRERTLEGRWTASTREGLGDMLRVGMDQPLARLAFYLLEPRSDDGLVNWNVLDEAIESASIYPVLRVAAASTVRSPDD